MVLRHREKISFGRADRIGIGDAQHAQIYLLHDIRHIGDIARAGEHEAAQLRSMACDEARNQFLRAFSLCQ